MNAMRDEELDIPCSSLAVDSILRIGTAGLAWGSFYGSHEAKKKGHTGHLRVFYTAKLARKCGLLCGVAAGSFSATRCRLQHYRMQRDWFNASVAGAVTGVVISARTRSLSQVLGTAAVASVLAGAADYSSGK